jgi:Zn-dependent protease
MGRVSLDPRVHFDTMGGVILGVTAILGAISGGGLLFGWAKPTPVNPLNLRHGRRGEALVSFAGPASNLVIAAIVAIPMRVVLDSDDARRLILTEPLAELAFNVGVLLLTLNIVLFIFNLVPIPPLDGWRVLGGLVPAPTAYRMRELEQRYANIMPMIFLGFIVVLFMSGGAILGPLINGVRNLLLGI